MSEPEATPVLEAEALLAEARRRTGLSDFGDEAFREPFERLLRSLREEAGLNAVGRAMQFERNVGLLVNRLRTEDHYAHHPEIAEERVEAPLVILGLPRTGTTMLHRMLAADPRWLALLWYESRNPAPFPDAEGVTVDPRAADAEGVTVDPRAADAEGVTVDPRIADAETEVAAMLEGSPDLIAAHPMDAVAPDEDIMLVEHAFLSWNPEAFCRLPGYAAWLEGTDMRPGYRYLLRLLRFLQWQKHRAGRQASRWVLKAPFHLGSLDALLEVFPDARFVMTHRDPVQTIPSICSLVRTLYVLGSDRVDRAEIGAHWSGRWARGLERAIAVREGCEERFLDVYYADLVADPMEQVARIYAHAGVELTEEARARMRQWAVENERDQRPVHAYTLEEFGFEESTLRAQFGAYVERFLGDRLRR